MSRKLIYTLHVNQAEGARQLKNARTKRLGNFVAPWGLYNWKYVVMVMNKYHVDDVAAY